jgi:uncharacterized membrane protein
MVSSWDLRFAIWDLRFGDINVVLMRVAHKELYYQGIREQKGGWVGLLLQFLLVYDQFSTTADC